MPEEELQPLPEQDDTVQEHILQNQDQHLTDLNNTSEHHLEIADSMDKTLEHSLEVQSKILESVSSPKPEVQKISIEPSATDDENELSKTLWNMLRGRTGEKGEKGDKGDKGDRGDDAPVLTPAEVADLLKPFIPEPVKGDTGPEGKQGIEGKEGKKGSKGDDGIDGKDGLDGKDGKDGTAITPAQIVKKIAGKLEYKDIKDAPDVAEISRIAGRVATRDYAFLELTDAPSSYAGQAGKAVIVKMTEDGLEFGTAGSTGVTSFNSRTGAVIPVAGDYSALSETLTNKTINASSNTITNIVNANISASAAIAVSKLAASTISGITLGSNLANLGVSGTSLSITGTYNGSTARNISLNLSNANTWAALQTFGTNISIGGVTATGATGTGNVVFDNSPTLITPTLGVATATSVNGVALTSAGSANAFLTGAGTYTAPFVLTTTGTSGPATFVAGTLNIPQYSGGGGGVASVASADGSITVTNPTTTVDLAVVKAPILSTARNIAITGDLAWNTNFDGSGNVTAAGTLATVNANVGTFGSATQVAQITANAKGLVTAVSNVTVTPAVGSITGLGSGVATFLATPTAANLSAALVGTTGTGSFVMATSPTLVTPVLGVATATSINKVTITAPTTSATLTLVTGSSLITAGANSLTLTTTGTTNVTFPSGTSTLVNTAVATLSSLASIGTITTGTWNASVIAGQYGGTGVNNSGKTITLGGNFVTSGAFATTLTSTATTNVTLPTTGTLATLAGTESFTNKTLTSSTNVLGGVTMTLGSDAAYDLYYRDSSGFLTRLGNGSTGQFLGANTGAAPSWQSAGGGTTPSIVVISATGTYTPTAGMKYVIVELVGGGGGGGGSITNGVTAGGGGAGGYSRKIISAATIGASQSVTIGAGGAGGVNNAAGSGGSTTSFGAIFSASGGSGGGFNTSADGGAGGAGSGGDFNATGAGGGPGVRGLGTGGVGGAGGASFFGGGANGSVTGSNAGTSYGGGGSGNGGNSGNGGAGSAGVVLITEYF